MKWRQWNHRDKDKKDREIGRPNAWKRYGALVLAGVLLAGTAYGSGTSYTAGVVNAQESEEPKRATLNLAGQEDAPEEETDAAGAALEETKESERVHLNIAGTSGTAGGDAGDADEAETAETETSEAETETAETETEAAETDITEETEIAEAYEEIPSVASSAGSIYTTDVSEIVANCMPSIVAITNISVEEMEFYRYGTMEIEEESTASGIIVSQNDTELLIATNSHVVDGATQLTVCFSVDAANEEELLVPAKIKGTNADYELAVVAVQLSDIAESVREQLRVAKLGSSDELKVGEAAIAIGNALGYGQSVTTGIISARNRLITIDNFSMEVLVTDAAINPGNSGGALLNAKGEVVGINVAKEIGDAAEGIGYSIPIDTAIPVLEQLINKETRDKLDDSERGYIGATVLDVSDDAISMYNMPSGAFVYEVTEGSAAELAGIKKGDIITAFEGESVSGSTSLIEKMGYYEPGETVTLTVATANDGAYETREVEITLQEGSSASSEGDETQEDGSDESAENGSQYWEDGYPDYYGFDDGFEDGFEEYNSQFWFYGDSQSGNRGF